MCSRLCLRLISGTCFAVNMKTQLNILKSELEPHSPLRAALPDLLRLLLTFISFATRPPQSEFSVHVTGAGNKENQVAWANKQLIAFGELCIRTIVGYYSSIARLPEIVEERLLVDIVAVSAVNVIILNFI